MTLARRSGTPVLGLVVLEVGLVLSPLVKRERIQVATGHRGVMAQLLCLGC